MTLTEKAFVVTFAWWWWAAYGGPMPPGPTNGGQWTRARFTSDDWAYGAAVLHERWLREARR